MHAHHTQNGGREAGKQSCQVGEEGSEVGIESSEEPWSSGVDGGESVERDLSGRQKQATTAAVLFSNAPAATGQQHGKPCQAVSLPSTRSKP